MRPASYRNVELWKQSLQLVLESFSITATFPPNEPLGLADRMRRSALTTAVSVAASFECACREVGIASGLPVDSSQSPDLQALLPDGLALADLSPHELTGLEALDRALREMLAQLDVEAIATTPPGPLT